MTDLLLALLAMDPTKLKSRTFQNSAQLSSAASKKGASSGPNLWTETPQERMQRLEDEMMGRKRKAEVSAGGGGHVEEESDDQRRKRMRDMQLKEEVERHNVRYTSPDLCFALLYSFSTAADLPSFFPSFFPSFSPAGRFPLGLSPRPTLQIGRQGQEQEGWREGGARYLGP